MPERDFIEGYEMVHGIAHADPKRLHLMMLARLDEAFPFHPALPHRILLRIGALAAMWNHPLMEAWKAAPSGSGLGSLALHVAATHPLTREGWFVPESFFAEMLRRMEDEGRA